MLTLLFCISFFFWKLLFLIYYKINNNNDNNNINNNNFGLNNQYYTQTLKIKFFFLYIFNYRIKMQEEDLKIVNSY
jgi:hypothetical protein